MSQQLEAVLSSASGFTGPDMRLGPATLACFLSFVWLSDCAPPTCYSRALGLSKEVMALLDKIHTYHLTVSERFTPVALSHSAEFGLLCSNDDVCWVAENVC